MSTQVAPFNPLATPGVNTLASSTVVDAMFESLRAAINANGTQVDNLPPAYSPRALSPMDYGAIADGLSHPLSSVYGSLAAAQVVYPFATALTQEIDYCACKKMSNTALGADGAEHADTNARLNRPMILPAGTYVFGNDVWTIRNASGVTLHGEGKRATRLTGNGIVLAFDGLWYSKIGNFSIIRLAAGAGEALKVDGNVPGHPYATRGVQGNRFSDMLVDGAMSDYAFTMCREGGSGGQGSENQFLNVHVQSSNFACYAQWGYNALNNAFWGGNIQGYNKHGIYLVAGQVSIFSVGFQSTTAYTQILNDGYDIDCNSGGVVDKIVVIGCRSESMRFYRGAGSQIPFIAACNGNPSGYVWGAGQAVALNTVLYKTVSGRTYWYRVTTAGTTGGVEPTWPTTGTVNDNTVVWTVTTVDWIHIVQGTIDKRTVASAAGRIIVESLPGQVEVNADYTLKPGDCDILVDSTAGPITITLPANNDTEWPSGTEVLITRFGADANLVTVVQADGGYPGYVPGSANLAGGSRSSVQLKHMGGGLVGRRWMLTAKVTWS